MKEGGQKLRRRGLEEEKEAWEGGNKLLYRINGNDVSSLSDRSSHCMSKTTNISECRERIRCSESDIRAD